MLKPLQKLQFWHFQKCFYLFFIEIFITLSGFPCPQEIGQSWPILKVTGKFEEKTWAKPFTFLKLSGKVMRKSIHVQQEQQHGYNLNLKLDTLAIVIWLCVCVCLCACMRACACVHMHTCASMCTYACMWTIKRNILHTSKNFNT